MNKQTAVEYLIQYMMNNQYFVGNDLADVFEQAKAMHKEEQRQTFEKAQKCTIKHDGVYFNHTSFDEYYNETYKGAEQ